MTSQVKADRRYSAYAMMVCPFFFAIYTYPQQPIFYELFSANERLIFSLITFAFLVVFISTESGLSKVSKSFLRFILCLTALCSLIYFNNNNLTTFRDGLVVAMLAAVAWAKRPLFFLVYRNMYLYFALWLGLTLIIVFILNIQGVNPAFYETHWLRLDPENSIEKRDDWDYAIVFGFITWVKNIDSLFRQPLLFTEPTYFGYYTIPLFFSALMVERGTLRALIAATFLTGIVLSASTIGLITLAIVPLLGWLLCRPPLRERSGLGLFALIMIPLASIFLTPEVLIRVISVLPGDKLAEFEYFLSRGAFFANGFSFSIFGVPEANEVVTYGVEVVAIRYGWVGVFAFIGSLAYLLRAALKILAVDSLGCSRKICGFSAIASGVFLSFKAPSLVSFPAILAAVYVTFYTRTKTGRFISI